MKSHLSITRRSRKIAPLLLAATGFSGCAFSQNATNVTSLPAPTVAANSVVLNNAVVSPEKTANVVRRLNYKIVGTFAHDARAFTEGLLWHDGGFYESVGLNGQSEIRRVAFPSGRVLDSRKNDAAIFGEGLALSGDRLVQLSWQNGRAFVYQKTSLKPLGELSYEGEGWGLAFDGASFVMSNGSDVLTFRDAKTFAPLRTIRVMWDGKPVNQLNELEWIDGKIWANVWHSDTILQIDPRDGRAVSFLDLTGIMPRLASNSGEDVLNGIAYDATRKRIFITGKWWPKLFQIEVQ